MAANASFALGDAGFLNITGEIRDVEGVRSVVLIFNFKLMQDIKGSHHFLLLAYTAEVIILGTAM